MKIAYIRPYNGEIDIAAAAVPDSEFFRAEEVVDMDEALRQEIEGLSVFVDYQVTKETLDLLPNLKFIATRSAGYDHIDTVAAAERGITISRVPRYGTRTVAEYAIALMFALSRNAFRSYVDMQKRSDITTFEAYEGFDLSGKTLGVVGTGAIGRSVCEIAKGIGMTVTAFDVYPDQEFAQTLGIKYRDLTEVLQVADMVTVHVPSMPETHHLLNEENLRAMKRGSYLINTARGDIVDTKALVGVLKEGHLAGAALDVLEGEHELREEAELLAAKEVDVTLWETLVANHALIDMQNVIVTPHIAFNTVEAKREITEITSENIKSFVAGDPKNVVEHA